MVNNHAITHKAQHKELCGKHNKSSDRAMVLDVQANQIQCGDSILIVDSMHQGKVAMVKKVSRAQLFLYS